MPKLELLATRSGRQIAVHRLATGTSGRTVVLCHPAPGAGNLDPVPEHTAARDLTLLSVDRAGYGQSEPLPDGQWATPSSAAEDLATVLDSLGTGPVGLAGWSAGGHVALALAAHRPDLVYRLVLFGTPAPDDELPWLPTEQRQTLDALGTSSPKAVRDAMAKMLKPLVQADPSAEDVLVLLNGGPGDQAALAVPGASDRLRAMLRAAFAQGVKPWAAEVVGYHLRPWGFTPDAVAAKTLLLYGSSDPIAAGKHAKWWVRQLKDARIELAPGGGHLLIFLHWKRALSHLAPGTKA